MGVVSNSLEVSTGDYVTGQIESGVTYDFVITEAGELRIGQGHWKLSDKAVSVKAAGEIKIGKDGKISYLANESGHYKPTRESIDNANKLLNEAGLTSDKIEIEYKW